MDKRYFEYCGTDRFFYDSPDHRATDPGFQIADRPLPHGWRARAVDGWRVYAPGWITLPSQGWKIHASARMDNAEEILRVVWDYCVPRSIAFKHLLGPRTLFANNAKYASRGSSAKLVTIYPQDDEQFSTILTELGPLLDGQPGAYILSDLRYGNGPLYVRYGGFARRFETFDRAEPEPAIEDAEGRPVPDRREPVFRVPSWVRVPEVLAPSLAARTAVTVASLPYTVDHALHFSNGGGVYVATHKDSGEQVILKEARPHAGLDGTGADAVSRLEREHAMLQRLDDLDFVPSVRARFIVGEHHFLAQQMVEGVPLRRELRRRFPYSTIGGDQAQRQRYVDWALEIMADVERNVAALGERGVVFGDLHMYNIIVRPDGGTSLIDFEVASLVEEGRRPTLAHPGFRPPADRCGLDIDRYALACLRLALFLPLTTLFPLDPGYPGRLARYIGEQFPVPEGYFAEAVRTIAGAGPEGLPAPDTFAGTFWSEPEPAPPQAQRWATTRHRMVGAILAAATPDRDDRLFPGDIEQFSTGGLNLAHGAAGVLYALSVSGAGRYPEHEAWLLERAARPDPGGRIGFYDGRHGVAYALAHFGHREAALSLIESCLGTPWRGLGLDLSGGLAGIGLNLQHFADLTGDPALHDAATEVAEAVAARLGPVEGVATTSGGRHPHAGLLRGSAGPALLFIRRYERTGDRAYLDLARTALDQDLRRCLPQADGSLLVDEGWRTMPYLATGSVGIGLVLQQFLRHVPDARYTDALAQITVAAQYGFYVQSGLFNGRAGMLLLHCGATGPDRRPAEIARQVRYLGWHSIDHQGHVAFAGDQLYRLSMDLATGTAGVLLALACVMRQPSATLPFLLPRHAGAPVVRPACRGDDPVIAGTAERR